MPARRPTIPPHVRLPECPGGWQPDWLPPRLPEQRGTPTLPPSMPRPPSTKVVSSTRPALPVLGLALAALALSSCSPEDQPLIRVGNQKVTVRDFARAGRSAQGQYEGSPELAKATLVQDLERRALMLELAHRLGQGRSPALDNVGRENEQRRAHEQGPYESLRPGMMDLMRQRKQRAAFNRAYLDMKADYDVQPGPGGAQLLFHVGNAVDPLKPSADQRRMPLGTYRGGVYTLEDALLDLQRSDASRPAFNLLPSIEIWIESQVMTRVAVLEARRRHLDEEPELVASLKAQRDQFLLDGVYQAAVANVPPPGPEQVRAVWERVKSRFSKLDTVRLAILELSDSALAGRVSM